MQNHKMFFLVLFLLLYSKCCAIDYSLHTIDTVVSLLCNETFYPDKSDIDESGSKVFKSMCRRLYRILLHAAYNHEQIFNKFEVFLFLCFFLFLLERIWLSMEFSRVLQSM
jgi:hypothetical protein